jgi:hypothetical protein
MSSAQGPEGWRSESAALGPESGELSKPRRVGKHMTMRARNNATDPKARLPNPAPITTALSKYRRAHQPESR